MGVNEHKVYACQRDHSLQASLEGSGRDSEAKLFGGMRTRSFVLSPFGFLAYQTSAKPEHRERGCPCQNKAGL